MLTIGIHFGTFTDVSGFDWDDEKNTLLQRTRGVGFEDVVFHIENGDVLDIVRHPNAERYPGQHVLVIEMDGYAYLVPYVKERGTRFLKTIIPSRKATKEYLK